MTYSRIVTLVGAVSVACLVAAASQSAQAGTTEYTFPGDPGSLAPTTTDPLVTASDVSFGSGADQNSVLSNALVTDADGGPFTEADAVSAGSYFQITLTPVGAINLTSLTFSATNGFPDGGVGVRSSADGFAADLETEVLPRYPTFTSVTVPVSGAEFQDLTAPVTFRFYTFTGNTNGNGEAAGGYEDLTFQETAATQVPEPTALSLIGFASCATILTNRRRRRQRTG